MQVENYVVDIIRSELGLDQQHIWIRSQNKKIPPNADELFVVVGVVDYLPISSKSYYDHTKDQERQVVYGRAMVQVDIFSRSIEARVRRAEILMALNSFYSQEIQNKYQFRIFELPSSFVNNSDLEGGSDINRFTIRFYSMCSEIKIKTTAYYDTFNAEINSDGTMITLNNVQVDPQLQSSE